MAFWNFISPFLLFLLNTIGGEGKSNKTNFVCYVHDTVNGKNVTTVTVAGVNGSSSGIDKFGTIIVTDDYVTQQPQISSKLVGRLKGLYFNGDVTGGGASYPAISTLVFQNDKNKLSSYNTLQLLGVDFFFEPKREIPVVGGTGKFRFARGYAIMTTVSFDGFNSVIKIKFTIRQ